MILQPESELTSSVIFRVPSPLPLEKNASKLNKLNESCNRWIQKQVLENEFCDLGPVFNDYEKHLASIKRQGMFFEIIVL